jgi:hypothetical protein
MPAIDRLMDRIRPLEYTEREIAQIDTQTRSQIFSTPPDYQVRSSPSVLDAPEVVAYNQDIEDLISPSPPAPAPSAKQIEETERLAYQIYQQTLQNRVNPTDQSLQQSWQTQSQAADLLGDLISGVPVADKERQDAVIRVWQNVAEALGGAGRTFADTIRTIGDAVSTFGRGIWYSIVGPPDDEDLQDEIAALKGTGLALMTAGGAGAAAAAATGVGAPVAAALGSVGLLGWALTDNFAGRLEFIQSQRQQEKRRREEEAKRQEEQAARSVKAQLDAIFDEIRSLTITANTARSVRQYDDAIRLLERAQELIGEARSFAEKNESSLELIKAKDSALAQLRSLERSISEQLKVMKEAAEAQKATGAAVTGRASEEESSFFSLREILKARADEIKRLIDAANTAIFQKSYDVAEKMLRDAMIALEDYSTIVEGNRSLLERFNHYAAYLASIRSFGKQIKAVEDSLAVARDPSDEQFAALSSRLRAAADEIKGITQAAETAKFAKNVQLAKDLYQQALDRVQKMKDLIDENRELLKKFGYLVVFGDQIRALENAILANLKALEGRIPNENVNNAVINYANSVVSRAMRNNSVVQQRRTFDLTNRDDLQYLQSLFRQNRKDLALLMLLTQLAQQLNELKPVETYQKSKLPTATILKLRRWLQRQIKTPLAKVANDIWNTNSGYHYSDYQVQLMHQALKDAGVSLSEVRNLKLRELEAILRARQYLYNASKRGYWHPYELELYRRLKELLMLTDQDVVRLMRLKLPKETEEVGGSVRV